MIIQVSKHIYQDYRFYSSVSDTGGLSYNPYYVGVPQIGTFIENPHETAYQNPKPIR